MRILTLSMETRKNVNFKYTSEPMCKAQFIVFKDQTKHCLTDF